MFTRYAIYYAPSGSEFHSRAAQWLGFDVASGKDVERLSFLEDAWVAAPRKYGFHGTLKAPFPLKPGVSSTQLQQSLTTFAKMTAPLQLGPLGVEKLDGFLALVPPPSQALTDLAFTIVRHFDAFRAPLSEADIARRNLAAMSPAQKALFLRWGYPNVAEHFKFHLTLSGKCDPETLTLLQDKAAVHFAQDCAEPFRIEDLCLFGEQTDGGFRLISRHPLG